MNVFLWIVQAVLAAAYGMAAAATGKIGRAVAGSDAMISALGPLLKPGAKGTEPTYGPGLPNRVSALALGGVDLALPSNSRPTRPKEPAHVA